MLLFLGIVFSVFKIILSSILGLPFWFIELIIFLSIIGSGVNIPVYSVKRYVPVVKEAVVTFMGIPLIIPKIDVEEEKTIIAVNLGGCIIPVLLSTYMIFIVVKMFGISILWRLFIAIIFNSLLINMIAKPVKGVGIATPAFLPPLFTAIVTLIFAPIEYGKILLFAFAYSVGTLGALIGADIMNLREIPKLGAPIASIGGAGTIDGVFLTGLLSVLFLL